jgi:hypothetical protein
MILLSSVLSMDGGRHTTVLTAAFRGFADALFVAVAAATVLPSLLQSADADALGAPGESTLGSNGTAADLGFRPRFGAVVVAIVVVDF